MPSIRSLFESLCPALCGVALFGASSGCASYLTTRTPAGGLCADMPVVPAGTEPDREYHRLIPVASPPEASKTEAERLYALRKAACRAGGDAVIEAVNEEVRGADGAYGVIASGTAVVWTSAKRAPAPGH